MKAAKQVSKVYDSYISRGFGEVHGFSPREYQLYFRYFSKNYDRYMPQAKDAVILDVGCGGGDFLYYLRKRGYTNCQGIDFSDECVDLCKRNSLTAQRADAFEYLSSKAGCFDAIVSNDVLEHLDKDQGFRLVELCWQALKEDGVLIIKVPNTACPVVGSRARYSDITHEMGFTDHSLRTLLLTCGFTEVHIFGPDIYVTRNPLANIAGKTLFYVVTAMFRVLYYLYGVRTRQVMTKHMIAVTRKVRNA